MELGTGAVAGLIGADDNIVRADELVPRRPTQPQSVVLFSKLQDLVVQDFVDYIATPLAGD